MFFLVLIHDSASAQVEQVVNWILSSDIDPIEISRILNQLP